MRHRWISTLFFIESPPLLISTETDSYLVRHGKKQTETLCFCNDFWGLPSCLAFPVVPISPRPRVYFPGTNFCHPPPGFRAIFTTGSHFVLAIALSLSLTFSPKGAKRGKKGIINVITGNIHGLPINDRLEIACSWIPSAWKSSPLCGCRTGMVRGVSCNESHTAAR